MSGFGLPPSPSPRPRSLSDSSALLKHECAYCLGQIQDPCAVYALSLVLADRDQEAMVRHEAAEALGAIGDQNSRGLLSAYTADPSREVAETCQLALCRLDWLKRGVGREGSTQNISLYTTVDPAPPCPEGSVQQWREQLLDTSLPLFQRYQAMFSLRNAGGEAAIAALVAGLGDGSTLFKHEVAYVLGQMKDERAVAGLQACLEDRREHAMLRHECAEALGSIASRECLAAISQFLQDEERVVKESCQVALDMYHYEKSGQFQYADAVATVTATGVH